LELLGETHVQCNGAPPPLQSLTQVDGRQIDPPGPLPRIDALYLHVPFCFHKCHYCDFYSIVDDRDRQEVFVRRLVAELHHRQLQTDLLPRTLFMGGGTPTLLRADLLSELLTALRDTGITREANEFTVEANPETVTPEIAAALGQGGVTRVSLGAQSFDPGLLKTLERWHDPTSVGRAVQLLRDVGFKRINLDLIFAIPGQSVSQLDADLDAALALGPDHVSCYSLTYEPNTAMTRRLELGQFVPMPETDERKMYERVIDRLHSEGFEHYEVSAFARRDPAPAPGSTPGKDPGSDAGADAETPSSQRCRHNMTYWTNGSWLGVGPSAASHVAGHRWKNAPHLGKYLDSTGEPPTIEHEKLTADRTLGEELMLRLRLIEGVEHSWLDARLHATDPRRSVIDYLKSIHMLQATASRLRLTRQGLCVADAVVAKLL
jgi:oxygen-independent coproporphyrinogen III oxidase